MRSLGENRINLRGRQGIFMIDASKGFLKDGNKNRLRAQDIHKIVDVFTRQEEIDGYSRLSRASRSRLCGSESKTCTLGFTPLRAG